MRTKKTTFLPMLMAGLGLNMSLNNPSPFNIHGWASLPNLDNRVERVGRRAKRRFKLDEYVLNLR